MYIDRTVFGYESNVNSTGLGYLYCESNVSPVHVQSKLVCKKSQ